MTTASSDVTRRELLSVAAVTGGAVLGGQLMPGAASAAAAQGGAAPAPRDFVLRPSGLRSTMNKRLEGRDEPILDRGLRIIDGHHHLFVRPALRYLLDDYLGDVRAGHRIVASVYVETLAFARTEGPELLRPVGEVEFANGVAAMTASGAFGEVRVCAAIIGHADMRLGDEVAKLLDRCLETAPERFRGVRQITLEHRSEAPFRPRTAAAWATKRSAWSRPSAPTCAPSSVATWP